jgi:hypothetical protein
MSGMDCQMKRFYRYQVAGTGIVPYESSIALSTGIAIHEGLADILTGVDIDSAVTNSIVRHRAAVHSYSDGDRPFEVVQEEQHRLIEGLIRVWHKFNYRTDSYIPPRDHTYVEKTYSAEYSMDGHKIIVMAKPDVVVDDLGMGDTPIAIDFKTVNQIGPTWSKKWMSDPQLALVAAITGIYNFRISALVKGRYSADWDSKLGAVSGQPRQQSPLCYAYRAEGNPPLRSDSWEPTLWYQTKYGNRRKLDSAFVLTSTAEYPGGVKEWVEYLAANHPDLCRDLVPSTSVFVISKSMADKTLQAVLGEEVAWLNRMEQLKKSPGMIDSIVPRSYNCHSYDGSRCEYYDPCMYGNSTMQDFDLLGKDYTRRVPHHKMELDHLVGIVQPK